MRHIPLQITEVNTQVKKKWMDVFAVSVGFECRNRTPRIIVLLRNSDSFSIFMHTALI